MDDALIKKITTYFFYVLTVVLLFFSIFSIIYSIKGWKKGASDSPLRLIILQLAIAILFQDCLIVSREFLKEDYQCKIFLALETPLMFCFPALLSSYIWILEQLLSLKNYFQLHPFMSYFILFLINWIIPYAISIINIYVLDEKDFLDNEYCRTKPNWCIAFIYLSNIVITISGCIKGFLIKRKYNDENSLNKNKEINKFIFVFIVYTINFIIQFIIKFGKVFEEASTGFYIYKLAKDAINNILPIIFFGLVCVNWVKKKQKSISDKGDINPFDSFIEEVQTQA